MINKSLGSIERNAAHWLRQGVSPSRLALTLALGFTIGCFPIVGIPVVICTALALTLRLNLPAILAANYAAWPFQIVLIVPFVRLGGWLVPNGSHQTMNVSTMLHTSHFGSLAGHAMLAWLVIAVPTVFLLTAIFTVLLRRVPALAAADAGN